MKKKLSIVVPAYNEEKNIAHLIAELSKSISSTGYDYELVFINDGSRDNTLQALEEQAAIYPHVFYIDLSRNFGKDYALKAGIDAANGDAIITMDADLQHPPHLLPELLKQWVEGYDIVYTYRAESNKHASAYQRFASKMFYKVVNALSDIKLENGISDFRLLDKRVVDELKQINEYEIFFRGMVKWVGFKQKGIPYTPAERHTGEASYSFFRLFKLAVGGIMAFSVRPLYIATGLGLFFSMSALLYIPYVLVSYFSGFDVVSGWASLIATVAFFGGLQLLVLGIIGSYLGKIFMQTKQRPTYIIRSSNLPK
ncbi:glycosyltransferase family 2 protein [Mucilaginibacter auburnensis]|uniref:Dolichol-phosphate mannosyltransferase n=1 Tax=Mucilaginibacter auburnensis TaxID=1457233 RepID=A0A2H9VM59_9SPHI|nr:glycosyltransferase family 2 protein [Mucilaginibacter auburnensis]PJJ79406.1 dolichol-phosphate mannosyltransferase [Mucilaginibacter auburnensis]